MRPQDIRGLREGQDAILRLSAYDVSRYGSLKAEVVRLSPDVTKDQRTGEAHYTGGLRAHETTIGGEPVKVGMQSDISIITAKRTVLEYLTGPIADFFGRALRER